ncbi:MAG: dihydrolipoyl dehydrogenase [Opitutales bacterium]|nr:dihydrolipoyl dehydrogenase [Opitutales bacterium]
MSESTFDIAIIGSGPGGYVCAIRAAQLGLKVALIEKDPYLGGTCLNVGCIPSKALLHSTELYHAIEHGEAHGIETGQLKMDIERLMKRKTQVVEQLRKGVEALISKRKVEHIQGWASFKDAQTVSVKGDKNSEVKAKNYVIATGSVPVELPFLKFDGKQIVSSDHAIAFDSIPKSMLVVGAGAIGLELSSVWARLGTQVTVVEFLPNIAAGSDDDISKLAERIFKKQGIKFSTATKVTSAEQKEDEVILKAERKGKELSFSAEKVLVAVGRKPFTDKLALDKAGVETDDKGRIKVKKLKTSADNIWAIGDVIEGPMLAHKAEEDGVAVAEMIAGKPGHVDYSKVPGVIYTHPEVASVGLTEKAAKNQGIEVKVGQFNLRANGRAIAQDATDGVAKIIADAKTDRILGAAIIAAGASEMIASIVAHMEYGGSAEDIARTIHAHPTISESIKEAAMDVSKSAIHAL